MNSGDQSGLAAKEKRLLLLAFAITTRDKELLHELRTTAPAGEPDREWRETLLQTHLFAGFPSVVEALRVLSRIGGLGKPASEEEAHEADDFERGQKLFSAVYGSNEELVRRQIASAHPLFERWVLGHAYGRVLSRDGLAPRMRELLAVTCLCAQGLERQLASHVRGAIALGATRNDVEEILTLLEGRIPEDALARARVVVQRYANGER